MSNILHDQTYPRAALRATTEVVFGVQGIGVTEIAKELTRLDAEKPTSFPPLPSDEKSAATPTRPVLPNGAKKRLPWWQANIGTFIVLMFAGYLVVLALAHFAPTPLWLTAARGFAIEKLGTLGDSFAPLTAIFAALAAFGAWRSYDAQRQLLEDERNRHNGTRFDETFFRLLEHNKSEVADLSVTIPAGQRAPADPGEYKSTHAIGAFKQTVKLLQMAGETTDKDTEIFESAFAYKYFRPLVLLRDQEIAITRWLKRQSKGVHVRLRGALLVAKLSDDELWFWYYAIESTSDAALIKFAKKLGIERKRAIEGKEPSEHPGA